MIGDNDGDKGLVIFQPEIVKTFKEAKPPTTLLGASTQDLFPTRKREHSCSQVKQTPRCETDSTR